MRQICLLRLIRILINDYMVATGYYLVKNDSGYRGFQHFMDLSLN